ncbi:hypothetical protein B0H14DRAFT_2638473, partial [Mycena olivaceomarginata]
MTRRPDERGRVPSSTGTASRGAFPGSAALHPVLRQACRWASTRRRGAPSWTPTPLGEGGWSGKQRLFYPAHPEESGSGSGSNNNSDNNGWNEINSGLGVGRVCLWVKFQRAAAVGGIHDGGGGAGTGESSEEASNFRAGMQIDMKMLGGDAVGNSISPTARDIVLAARRGLFIIDLASPLSVPRFLPQGGTLGRRGRAVESARQQGRVHRQHELGEATNLEPPPPLPFIPLLLFLVPLPLSSSSPSSSSSPAASLAGHGTNGKNPAPATASAPSSISHVLHAHYRAITDINWHPAEAERDVVASTVRGLEVPHGGRSAAPFYLLPHAYNVEVHGANADARTGIDSWIWAWDLRAAAGGRACLGCPAAPKSSGTGRTPRPRVEPCGGGAHLGSEEAHFVLWYPTHRAFGWPWCFAQNPGLEEHCGHVVPFLFSFSSRDSPGVVAKASGKGGLGRNGGVTTWMVWDVGATTGTGEHGGGLYGGADSLPDDHAQDHRDRYNTGLYAPTHTPAHTIRTAHPRGGTGLGMYAFGPSPARSRASSGSSPQRTRTRARKRRRDEDDDSDSEVEDEGRRRDGRVAGRVGMGRGRGRLCGVGRDEPVEVFEGHTDVVKEFVWRRGGVITWSKDRTLRFWPVDAETMAKVGYVRPQSPSPDPYRHQPRPYSRMSCLDLRQPNRDTEEENLSPPAPTFSFRNPPPPEPLDASILTRMRAAHRGWRGQRRGCRAGRRVGGVGMDALTWLSNVKEVAGGGGERSSSGGRGGAGSSGGDRLTSVINKLVSAKIKLEKHDLTKKRNCTLGLHGPWGESSSVFIRITFTFPKDYPHGIYPRGTPTVELERNPLISLKNRAFILRRLRALRERQRPCLEACLRFLSEGEKSGAPHTMDSESSDEDQDNRKSRDLT